MAFLNPLTVGLVLALSFAGAARADFTDAQARQMVGAATVEARAGRYLKGDALVPALIGRVFQARVPGKTVVNTIQFYSTSYTVSSGSGGYTMYDWKVSRNFFCFKPRNHKNFACRHRLVKLTTGTVLVGKSLADGIAMKPKIKALR